MYDQKNWKWTNPDTQEEYDLKHMQGFMHEFEVMLAKDGDKTIVKARVNFSNHCFSATAKEGDDPRWVISKEKKKGDICEERVFCPIRWEFSKRLPGILQELAYKNCLEGGSGEILYRQEDASSQGQHDGWYICIRMSYRKGQLELWVRSAHWRPNRPADIRSHGARRFCVLLSNYLKSKVASP